MNTPFALEHSDLAVWPETITLVDCAGGMHPVRGRFTNTPEGASELADLPSESGQQINCDMPPTDLKITRVRLTVAEQVREYTVIDQERRRAIFAHMRLSLNDHWRAV